MRGRSVQQSNVGSGPEELRECVQDPARPQQLSASAVPRAVFPGVQFLGAGSRCSGKQGVSALAPCPSGAIRGSSNPAGV